MSRAGKREKRAFQDGYETPPWCVRALTPCLPAGWQQMRILEPGCGTGNIMTALVEMGADREKILGVEIDEARARQANRAGFRVMRTSFLTDSRLALLDGRVDLIIGNPPYQSAQAFAERAIEMCQREDHQGDALTFFLLRLNFYEGQKRALWLRDRVPDAIVLPRRPSFSIDGKPTGGTDATGYAWFVFYPYPRTEGSIRIADLSDCANGPRGEDS